MERRPPEPPEGAKDPPVDCAPSHGGMSGTPAAGGRQWAPLRSVLGGDLAGAHIDAPVNLVRD